MSLNIISFMVENLAIRHSVPKFAQIEDYENNH